MSVNDDFFNQFNLLPSREESKKGGWVKVKFDKVIDTIAFGLCCVPLPVPLPPNNFRVQQPFRWPNVYIEKLPKKRMNFFLNQQLMNFMQNFYLKLGFSIPQLKVELS